MKRPLCIVTGKNGQLGRCLHDLALSDNTVDFLFVDRSELDITNEQQIIDHFIRYQPQYLINTAAYTAVDKAETEQASAYTINTAATGRLAFHAFQNNCRFIHLSTDYVFDGTAAAPYKTEHSPHPINYYGYSKWQGEVLALHNNPDSIIIRTSWLYSEYGHNFVKTMMRLMQEKQELNIVNDQTGAPTYGGDLAAAIINIIHSTIHIKPAGGIYHFSNSGVTTWYDFAIAIKNYFQYSCNLNPIPTSAYPTPAKRPMFSLLDTAKIIADFNIPISDWQNSLIDCLKKLR